VRAKLPTAKVSNKKLSGENTRGGKYRYKMYKKQRR